MTGNLLIDAAIGVVFSILTFSLVASALTEALAALLNWRGRMLRRGLARLLGAVDGLARAVLADPSIRILHGPARGPHPGRLPSAIPAETFARALFDALMRRAEPPVGEGGEIDRLPMDASLRRRLRRSLVEVREARALEDLGRNGPADDEATHRMARAEASLATLVRDLADWYGTMTDRMRGWYQRRVRLALFAIGFGLAMAANFDLTGHAAELVRDSALRTGTVEAARAVDGPEHRARTLASGLPAMGRDCAPAETWADCLVRTLRWQALISWLVIAFGATLGGQFWFDLLQVLLRLRPVPEPGAAARRAPGNAR